MLRPGAQRLASALGARLTHPLTCSGIQITASQRKEMGGFLEIVTRPLSLDFLALTRQKRVNSR